MGDAGIDAILQFHFVFDEIGCISGYADVFEAIENEILLCFERLGERFKFGGECEEQIKKALMKFARSDRKKIGISKILPRFTAQKITADLINAKFLITEKSSEQRAQKARKNDRLPRALRRYHITDKVHFSSNFARFWFRFIEPNLPALRRGEIGRVLSLIKADFNAYAGLGFEILSKELLAKYLNLEISQISSFWNKEVEIDIYAKFESFCVAGECKYKERKISKNVLNELMLKCEKAHLAPDLLALFSKSGFSGELVSLKSDKILLFSLEDFKILL
nr:DUF234 domain-containing protein [uncultured Campylobacter sp.]